MLWRKLTRKIFKDRRHIGITLYSTSQCDTGCSHCIDNSDCKNPVHFTKELAETIVKEARRERWMLSALLTGGGEPLMTPELIGIADAFGNYERSHTFGIITSGFTDNEPHRKQQFETLLKRPYAKKMSIDQSFSLYHSSFPERLANTARLMMNLRKKSHFRIRACMSLDNFRQTQWKIEEVVKNLAKEIEATGFSLPLGWHEADRRLFHYFESKLIGDKTAYKLGVEAFLTPQWHAIKTKDGGIIMIVQPISLTHEGRGSSIEQSPYGYCTCDALRTFWEDTYLIVGPDGSVYPECSCFPTEHMRLGKIGEDSLVELIRRKDIFAERITQAILADNRMCKWGTSEVCTLCKQIVAEKGTGLQ